MCAWAEVAVMPHLRCLTLFECGTWGRAELALDGDIEPGLTALDVEDFGDVTGEVLAADQALLARMLPRFQQLQTLILGPWMDPAQAEAFAAALPRLPQLARLSLAIEYYSRRHHSLALLLRALPGCKALEVLSLENHHVASQWLSVLAEVLPRCSKLQTLLCRWASYEDRSEDSGSSDDEVDVNPVLRALRSCSRLRELLFDVCTSSAVAFLLCRELEGHASLERLCVSCRDEEWNECEELAVQLLPQVVVTHVVDEDFEQNNYQDWFDAFSVF